jgi:hypothetical protein
VTGFANVEEDLSDKAAGEMEALERGRHIMPGRIEDELRALDANFVQAGLWKGFARSETATWLPASRTSAAAKPHGSSSRPRANDRAMTTRTRVPIRTEGLRTLTRKVTRVLTGQNFALSNIAH